MAEQNLQKIRHTDQLIFDEDQNLVGIKNPKGHGEDFLPVRLSTDGTSLVSTDGNTYVLTPTGRIADAVSRDITAADNGKSLAPTGTLTYTIPAGLSPMPSFTVDCPASGTITIARSGGATLNGAGTSLTRTRANNPVGFVVLAHTDTDAYGVSGA